MLEQIESSTRKILELTRQFKPEFGLILGSGLSGLTREITVEFVLLYSEVPGFPDTTVEGHPGKLIFGELGGKKVMAMQGRFHYYEGYSMQQIGFPVRVMKALGVKSLVVSNACGGMNPEFSIGDIMVITDHINLFPDNPLIGKNHEQQGPRFPDMSEVYDTGYIRLAKEIATSYSIKLKEGVYVGLSGPCFETQAEYRYLRRIGGDAVGMSTVPEVIVAKHAGLRIFGIGIVTDLGIEGRVSTITHEEVQQVATEKEPQLSQIVKELVKRA